METARRAEPADLPSVAALAAEARAEVAVQRGGALLLVDDRAPLAAGAGADGGDPELESWLERPDALLVVGTIDGVVVGYAAAEVRRPPVGPTIGTVTDLFVEPGAREVGVGEAMMGRLVEWLDAQRCSGIDAVALPGNRAAKNFFERSGFTARLLVMHRPL
jgi:ribosomal protein S18 acetylase RimI-like enzyme